MTDSKGMSNLLLVTPPSGAEGFVNLSRSASGRLFKKHILSFGELHYPGVKGGKVIIDEAFATALKENFDAGVCDIVQVPKVDAKNIHSEDPDRNIGEVVGLSVENKKIYATIDVRDDEAVPRLGKTLLGASAMLSLNYTDTRTGTAAGPTLLHVAVTNRPHIVNLEGYEEIVAASADSNSEKILLTATNVEDEMPLDELLATLKAEHNIDVDSLQRQANQSTEQSKVAVSLSNAIKENLGSAGILKLSHDGEPATADLVQAVTEAGAQILSLSNTVEELKTAKAKDEAEHRVDEEIRKGTILPKDKDAQIELLLSNSDLFERLLPEKPLIQLSNESGNDIIIPGELDDADTVAQSYVDTYVTK